MTYCIGWKTGGAIIIAADTAITSDERGAVPGNVQHSSFGEPHIRQNGEVVEERGLKIYRFENMLLTFAGSTTVAHEVSKAIRRDLNIGVRPREAVKMAVGVNVNPGDSRIQLISAFNEGQDRILLSFNANGDEQFVDEPNLVQFGSAPEPIKDCTRNLLTQLTPYSGTAEQRTAELLGALQTYGMTMSMMTVGVGGAYVGAYLDESGTHWQKDIVFIVNRDDLSYSPLVSTCVRDDMLVISSPAYRASKALANFTSDQLTGQTTVERCMWAVREGRLQHNRGKFDFIVVINGEFPIVTVVEMKRKLKHDLIWVMPSVTPTGTALAFHLAPRLRHLRDYPAMNGSGNPVPTLNFVGYQKPSGQCSISAALGRSTRHHETARGDMIRRSLY
ncbi:MAG: hypothetical protein WC497_05965 [Patescibacteria group bacterium]